MPEQIDKSFPTSNSNNTKIEGLGGQSKESVYRHIRKIYSLKPADTSLATDRGREFLRKIFENISSNPTLLLDMPTLYLTMEEIENDSVEVNLDFSVSNALKGHPNREGLETWARKIGIENLEDFYNRILIDPMNEIINPSLGFTELLGFYSKSEGGDMQAATIFDLLKLQLQKHLYAERLLMQARGLLAKHLPDALPQEPTEVLVRHDNDKMWSPSAEYHEKLQGVHYITMQFPFTKEYIDKREEPMSQEENLMVMVHELIHQRHAEVVGQETFLGLAVDTLIEDEEFKKLPVDRSLELIRSRWVEYLRESRVKGITISDAITSPFKEGAATLGSLFVLNQRIREAEEIGDMEAANTLRKLKKKTIISNFEWALRDKDGIGSDDPYTIGVFKLLKGLYKKFGLKNLPSLMKAVDLNKCRRIEKDTPEYERIMADSTQLPGLENYRYPQR